MSAPFILMLPPQHSSHATMSFFFVAVSQNEVSLLCWHHPFSWPVAIMPKYNFMHEVRLGICGGLAKINVFWDVIMYQWVSTSSCFEALYCFILKQFKKRHCPRLAWHCSASSWSNSISSTVLGLLGAVVLYLKAIQEEALKMKAPDPFQHQELFTQQQNVTYRVHWI